jgi:alpha-1,2-mannosyltransferase
MDAEVRVGRGRVRGWWLPALYGVLAAGTAGLILLRPAADRLADLHVYWGASRAVLDGQPLYGFQAGNGDPFTYPPFALLLFLPLGLVPEPVVGVAWTAATFAAFVALARLVVTRWPRHRAGNERAWVWACAIGLLVSAPGQSNVRFGQVSVFVVLLALADAVGAVPSRWRGLLVGVAAAVKLTPLLFVAFFLLAGRRREAAQAAAGFAGCAAVAGVLMPQASWTYWTSAMVSTSRIGDLAALGNQSLNGILLRAGIAPDWRPLLWAALLAVVCAAALWRARALHRAGLEVHAVVLVGCATVAASPVSWTHHQFWTVMAAMLLVAGPATMHRAAGWALVASLTVNLADVVARLRLGDHAVFIAANLRGLAAATLCVLGFGAVAQTRASRASWASDVLIGEPPDVTASGRGGRTPWPRPSRRMLAGAGAVGLLFALTPLPIEANLGVYPAAALRIVFADLHADPAAVNAELRRRHLGLTLTFQPTSPSLVGTPLGASVATDGQFERLAATFEHRPGSSDPDGVVAVTVPADLRGDVLLFVGRPARPGENYASTPQGGAEAPGEVLHCHPVRGLRVAQSLHQFAAAGVTPVWRTDGLDDASTGVAYRNVQNGSIVGVDPINDRQVWVWVSENPFTRTEHDYQAVTAMDHPGQGCDHHGATAAGQHGGARPRI